MLGLIREKPQRFRTLTPALTEQLIQQIRIHRDIHYFLTIQPVFEVVAADDQPGVLEFTNAFGRRC